MAAEMSSWQAHMKLTEAMKGLFPKEQDKIKRTRLLSKDSVLLCGEQKAVQVQTPVTRPK
jgi:hypothetical protein